MAMDGGLGAVVEKKQIAVSDTLSRGYLQAVQHNNGIDWWLISPEWNSNCYYTFPITSEGVGEAEKQCIGGVWNNLDGGGQSTFSPDRTKYVRVEAENGWYMFDFDASTGLLSNPIILFDAEIDNYFRGASFSSNSRYLYVSSRLDLFQFALDAEDIAGSKQLVGQLNPDDAVSGVGTLALQKLAPDGRIYIASPGSHKFLSVINRPNCAGTLCNFQPWSVELPESNYSGLPNLPHFSIPTSDTACDSITSSTFLVSSNILELYPNPVTDYLNISWNIPTKGQVQWQLYNALGQQLKTVELSSTTTEHQIDLKGITAGIYFYTLEQEGHTLTSGKVLISN